MKRTSQGPTGLKKAAEGSVKGDDNTRQRLIDTALQHIATHGVAGLTVRGVAAAAGANIAAVNYYFRSKDALVREVLEVTIRNLLVDTDELLARMKSDPHVALAGLLSYYLDGGLRFPGISKAHMHNAFSSDDYTGLFPTSFVPVIERIRDAIRAHVPGLDAAAAGRRTVFALSAVFFPVFFSGLFRTMHALGTPGGRLQYVEEIVAAALAPAK
jgi:AcrR family transcriptional regulator